MKLLRNLAFLPLALSVACGGSSRPAGSAPPRAAADAGDASANTPAAGRRSLAGARVNSRAWPEADALFHSDSRWRGGDAALSIPLGGARVLWLFGDSFVARGETAASRKDCTMIRNSIAIQHGLRPDKATITYYWGSPGAAPRAYFARSDTTWYWPGHGARVNDALYLFLHRIRGTGDEGLGFEPDGWELARLTGIDGEPDAWRTEIVGTVSVPWPSVVGASVFVDSEHLVAVSVNEPGDHGIRLVRWPIAALEKGELSAAEWWSGSAWVLGSKLEGEPAIVANDVSTEMSLTRDPSGQWLLVYSRGFGASDIVARAAASSIGPFADPARWHRPAESDAPDPFVYAGKSHPELEGADMVVTYATNSFDFGKLVEDESLYYPRFVAIDATR